MDVVFLITTAVLTALVTGIVVAVVYRWLKRREEVNKDDQMMRLLQLNREEIESQKKQINETATEREDRFRKAISDIREDLRAHREHLERTEKERIGQFKTLTSVMDEYKVVTSGLKSSTDDLKNLLSNNQMRGKFGEEVAENLLKSVGFVRGQYTVNETMEKSNKRPDFTINLPDGTKVNVDVKFPFSALVKYQETDDENEQKLHMRQFEKDVKEKIKQVRGRDYINPEENTVDFVILFVPNEMIFSFIYNNLHDVWNDAIKHKVILAGPFSFTAILRMIYQSYKNFTYQENLMDIIKLIKTFETEYTKFSDALDTLGSRLESVQKQYQQVSVTRTKKLTGVVEKILSEHEEMDEGEKPKIAEQSSEE